MELNKLYEKYLNQTKQKAFEIKRLVLLLFGKRGVELLRLRSVPVWGICVKFGQNVRNLLVGREFEVFGKIAVPINNIAVVR